MSAMTRTRLAMRIIEWRLRIFEWSLHRRRLPWFYVGHVGIAFMPWMKLPGVRRYGDIRVGCFGPLVMSWGR